MNGILTASHERKLHCRATFFAVLSVHPTLMLLLPFDSMALRCFTGQERLVQSPHLLAVWWHRQFESATEAAIHQAFRAKSNSPTDPSGIQMILDWDSTKSTPCLLRLPFPSREIQVCANFELLYHAAAAFPRLGPFALVPLPPAAVESSQAGDEGLVLVPLQEAPPDHLQLPKLQPLEAGGTGLHLSGFISSSSWNKNTSSMGRLLGKLPMFEKGEKVFPSRCWDQQEVMLRTSHQTVIYQNEMASWEGWSLQILLPVSGAPGCNLGTPNHLWCYLCLLLATTGSSGKWIH